MHRSSVTAVPHRERLSTSNQGGYSSVHQRLAAVAIACLLIAGCTGTAAHEVPPSTAPSSSISAEPEPSQPCGSAIRLEVPGTSNIFGAGVAQPPAPAGGGAGAIRRACRSREGRRPSTSTRQAASISKLSGSTTLRSSTDARKGMKSPHRYPDPTDPRSAAARPTQGARPSPRPASSRGSRPVVVSATWSASFCPTPSRRVLLLRASTSETTTTSQRSVPRCVRPSSSVTGIRAMERCSGSVCQ